MYLRDFEVQSHAQLPAQVVREHYDVIQQLCDGDNIEAVVANILAWSGEDKWMERAVKTLTNGCPTSVYLIDEQFKRGKYLSLREAFQLELILSVNCMRFPSFREGVRALLIDKDHAPKFEPATLGEVTPEFVAAHFVAPWGNEPNPLANL